MAEKMTDFQFKNLPPVLKKAILKCPLIIGVAPNAWPRIAPSWFFPKFKILCYRDRYENDYIAHAGIEIFSIRKASPNFEVSRLSASGILESEPAQEFLNSQKEPFALLVYKPTGILDKMAQANNRRLIANTAEKREAFENKRLFREALEKSGVEPIPGENLLIEQLTEDKFCFFQKKFGQKKLVLQLAEATYGGGSGTLFLDQAADLKIFRQGVEEMREKLEGKKKKIETVNVTPFITGTSPSIACCTTRHGVLVGPVQTQMLDVAEVKMKRKDRSGNFAGHDWSFRHYSEKIQSQAEAIAEKLGTYMYRQGYRGIFGLDLLVEEGTGKVWPVECNPRYTDAFPMISLLLMEKGVLPMDVFHILELLDVDYEIDFQKLKQGYRLKLEGSQVILHSHRPTGELAVNKGVLKAGVYSLREGELVFLRPGFTPLDLEGEDEFLFTEGVPIDKGEVFKGTARICRLIRKGRMLARPASLRPEVKEVVRLAYESLQLEAT